jgi:sulfide:quinone oxidoreductase
MTSRVVIAGAGVAGLETALALKELAGDRCAITIVSPERKFVNRSMAVDQPFKPRRVRGLSLEDAAAHLGAEWRRGTLDHVDHEHRVAITRDRDQIPYDYLVLAVGARPDSRWYAERMLTYRDGRDAAAYRLLLSWLARHRLSRLAFVKPAGASWPLPLYGLALATAANCRRQGSETEITLVTPEPEPLAMFGKAAAAATRELLRDAGIQMFTSSYALPGRAGWLDVSPGHRSVPADAIVTLPRLVGPLLRGIPCTGNGFIRTDDHGRVPGIEGVFAAGDATAFAVKQGGIASQQADAVAEAIAAEVGVELDPEPFHPVLRGLLLTGGRPRYLRSDISGRVGDDSTVSLDPLWRPPNKLCARYLSPYLSSQTGDAADVMGAG